MGSFAGSVPDRVGGAVELGLINNNDLVPCIMISSVNPIYAGPVCPIRKSKILDRLGQFPVRILKLRQWYIAQQGNHASALCSSWSLEAVVSLGAPIVGGLGVFF